MRRTIRQASSSARNAKRKVRTTAGDGVRRTVNSVAIPNVPSDATKVPTRSSPGSSRRVPPSSTISPSAVTTVSPSTWSVVVPYFIVCGPPEFSATFPPSVHAVCDDGSGA
jgi:hypothetical protein